MSFKLKEVVFRIRCTEPGCSFNNDISIKENLMGATESDIDVEAWKIAKNQAFIKHDSLFGRNHPLRNPEIHKVSGYYDRFGGSALPIAQLPARPAAAVPTRSFKKREPIIRKGEKATTVLEVVQGYAYNAKRPSIKYEPGATFGSAALLKHKNRMADIVAGEDGTQIAFYDLRTLSETDPVKARALYNEAMEDIFRVIEYLDDYSQSLESRLNRIKAAGKPVKAAGKKGKPVKKPAPVRKPAPKLKAKAKAKAEPAAKKKAPAKKTPVKKAPAKKPARPASKKLPRPALKKALKKPVKKPAPKVKARKR